MSTFTKQNVSFYQVLELAEDDFTLCTRLKIKQFNTKKGTDLVLIRHLESTN